MTRPLSVLLIEDCEDDALLIIKELKRGGRQLEHRCIASRREMETSLADRDWDVIVSDHNMPGFSAPAALEILKEQGKDIPFIIVSGVIDAKTAVQAMTRGAKDYLEKDDLTRLNAVVDREVEDAGIRRDKALAQAALAESEKRLRYLSGQLIRVQEQERKRLAAEIHDSVGQLLAVINVRVQAIMHRIETGAPRTKDTSFDAVVPLIKGTIDEVRRIQSALRPAMLDDIGVLSTLDWFVREFRKAYPEIKISKSVDVEEEAIPEDVKTAVYRIVQESLNNVAKHSRAGKVSIALKRKEDSVVLTIKDDGLGFDTSESAERAVKSGSLGLISMSERVQLTGGEFSLNSQEGEGTTIKAAWPL